MMEESHVPHPFEMTKVPHPFETQALSIDEFTLNTTTKAPTTDDMDVTSPVEIDVTSMASKELCVQTNGWFLGGISECSVLIRYADNVALNLFQRGVYMIC